MGRASGRTSRGCKESRYLWSVDSEGKLITLDDPADDGVMVQFVAWIRTSDDPGQVIVSTVAEARNAVEVFDVGRYIYGCVAPSAGEIHLNSNGRTHTLFCTTSFILTSIDYTADPNWNHCVEVFPRDPNAGQLWYSVEIDPSRACQHRQR